MPIEHSAKWCAATEALIPQSKTVLCTGKWGSRVTLHHNFISNSEERMPEIGHWVLAATTGDSRGHLVDVRNNFMHHWGAHEAARTAQSHASASIRFNLIANNFQPGPQTDEHIAFRLKNAPARPFMNSNSWIDSIYANQGTYQDPYWEDDTREPDTSNFQSHRFLCEYVPTNLAAASSWAGAVLDKAGDHRYRDAVDARARASALSSPPKGKIIDNILSGRDYAVAEFGQSTTSYTSAGWPIIPSNEWPSEYDADRDGMRDAWEAQWLTPGHSVGQFLPWDDADGDGFTNLEEFLNKTNPTVGDDSDDRSVHSHVEDTL